MNKVLSISIAAYNVEAYLEECIKSIVESNIINKIEILVINDGSNDTTLDIAKSYADKYPNSIYVIDKENGGWGSTLNSSIKVARGKYFKQLDADDLYSTEELADFVSKLEREDADIVITRYATFRQIKGKGITICDCLRDDAYKNNVLYSINKLPENNNIDMHAVTVKTSILRRNGVELLEKCFYTDVEFVIKVLNNSNTFVKYNNTIYMYRLNRDGQSMSLAGIRKNYNDHLKALVSNLDYINQEGRSEIIRHLRNRMQSMVNMQYFFFLCLECNKKNKTKLRKYDKLIKGKYREYYMNVGKKIWMLRLTNYLLYPWISKKCEKEMH